jgi:tetratricopeptide (TPR) repeat protein
MIRDPREMTKYPREKKCDCSDPDTAGSLNNLAGLYHNQGKYAEAEPLYRRALAICERTLGSEHPTTRTIQANYIALLKAVKQDEETA